MNITPILATSFSVYAGLGMLIMMALVFGGANLILTKLLGPSRTGKVKEMVYESGMDPLDTGRKPFNLRFYIIAMTFLLFDVEIVFLYPWAMAFTGLGDSVGAEALRPWFLARVAFFILTSILGFIYAWRKGIFRYDG